MTTATPAASYLETLDPIIREIIAPSAAEIDRTAAFPRAAVEALSAAGLLGLVSALAVGGKVMLTFS